MSTNPPGPDPGPNPYEPPRSPLEEGAPPASPGAEALRQKYLAHETTVKAAGLLHGPAGLAILALTGLAAFEAARTTGGSFEVVFVLGAAAVLSLALGYGLVRLQPWARWIEGGLCVVGLVLALGVGLAVRLVLVGPYRIGAAWLITVLATLLAGVLPGFGASLFFSRSSAVVFSPGYRAAIRQTPHLRWRASFGLIFLVVVMAGFLTLAVMSMFAGQSLVVPAPVPPPLAPTTAPGG